jgi:DNA helicase-2/ATP-dependent DNA helicase PcrA
VIELGPASHRDPSQVIPAMAFSILNGDFESEAVAAAVDSGRLRVVACPAQGETNAIIEEIRNARHNGCRTVGVFETTNLLAAQLGAELSNHGISYGLLGIPEAQAEGVTAQAQLLAFGLGHGDFEEARVQLAVFLTAVSRGNVAPPLAIQIRDNQIVSPDLRMRFDALAEALVASTGVDDLLTIIRGTWDGLHMASGRSAWDRANRSFEPLARRVLAAPASVESLAERVLIATDELRNAALHTGDAQERSNLHLLNRHQTKGREWDGVILVFRHDGWVTSEPQPYAEAFRLLYVTLTRARQRACVLVPPRPHEVIAPFAAFC